MEARDFSRGRLHYEQLLNGNDNDKKLYNTYVEIKQSDTEPWNGKGDIPKSYYK